MVVMKNNYSQIELMDGVYRLRLKNGQSSNIFLYKYKHMDDNTRPEDVFNTSFNYDFVVLDNDNRAYLYFTYTYIDDPEEVF